MIPNQTLPPKQQMMNHGNQPPQPIQSQQQQLQQPPHPPQPIQSQPHQFRPLEENAEIPFLQIVTPNQMIKLPPMFQEQYKSLLIRWGNQCIRKSGRPYTQIVPYHQVLVLLEISKNGDIQEYRDYIQVIIESHNNIEKQKGEGEAKEEEEEEIIISTNNNINLKNIINLKDLEGNTSIHYAIMRKNKSMVSYLIDCGSNLDIQNCEEGHTPLHWACIKADSSFVLQLVENGADINLRDKRGYNALLHAAQYNEIHSVRYLIEKGLDPVQCKDVQGHTAVHWASFQGHSNMARYFISLGVDANAQDIQGRTAFHWACFKGHKSVVTMLCSFDGQDTIDKGIRDTDGKTGYELASVKQHSHIIDYLNSKLKDDKIFNGSEKDYHRFWILMGMFSVLVPTWILCYVPVLFGLPLLGGVGYFLKNYLHLNYWIPERNNWLLPTILYSSVSIWYVVYLLKIAPMVISLNMVPHLLVNAMCWYFFYFFIRLTKEDPGTVSKHLSKQDSTRNFMDALSSGRPQLPLICPTCLINRPIRSKHCPSCKGCFARFDHHCVWINKCIGINNQALFITVLCSYVTLVISGFFIVLDYFSADPNAPSFSESSLAESWLYYYTNYTFVLLFSIYGIGMAFWIGKLAISQILTIVFNKTTYEQIQQIREFESRQNNSHGHSHGGDNHNHSHGGGAECNHSHGGDNHNHSHGSGGGDHSSGSSKKDSDKSFHNQQTNFDMYHRGAVNNVKEFLFDYKKFYFQTENIYADSRV